MSPAGGYFGRALVIDVSTGAIARPTLDDDLLRAFVGGVGLGTVLLSRAIDPEADPLAAPCLVIAFSPFVGTSITTSAKVAFVAKSPLTDRLSDALSSSDFAVAGKRTGHDAIVLSGRAPAPSVVLVEDESVRIEPAGELWGRTIDEAEILLVERHPGFRFALIGPAGEALVRYACIANQGRHAGRGGLGAVLGAMNVKAIGVRGSRGVPIADPPRLIGIARDLARRSLGPATEKYRELGTVANLAAFNRLAVLPTRNFQEARFDEAEALGGERLQATRAAGRASCRSCTIGCAHYFDSEKGAVKLEYESVFALGPLCGVGDAAVTIEACRRADALGLDTISAGGTIAFAMECAERGLLTDTPWERPDLRFGSAALPSLLEEIAARATPLGDLLTEGSRRAAARIGPPAPGFAPHVKGLELPGYEPRGLRTMALGFPVGTRGADHNKSGAYEVDFSTQTNRFDPGPEAAVAAVASEDRAALFDSLILCKFLRGIFDDVYGETGEALGAVTGWKLAPGELAGAARRIVLAKRRFNERAGWTLAEDTLPERMFTEGASGGAAIDRARFEALRGAYYATRGLDQGGAMTRKEAAMLDAWLVPRDK
jgi:aldehyde:ferredoxin oxidoreductase